MKWLIRSDDVSLMQNNDSNKEKSEIDSNNVSDLQRIWREEIGFYNSTWNKQLLATHLANILANILYWRWTHSYT